MIERILRDNPEAFLVRGTGLASVGIQSQIERGELGGVEAIRKVAGGELGLDRLNTLADAMDVYRGQLREVGVNVPDNFILNVTDDGIETVDEFIEGQDVDIALRSGDGVREWTGIIETLCDLQTRGNEAVVMIDAKPANWIQNGRLYFIDLYPPPLRDESGMIAPWVPELYKRSRRLFTFNYGDTRGQITKLLAGAKGVYPDRYEALRETTLEIVNRRLNGDKRDYIIEQVEQEFPDMNLFYGSPEAGEERLRKLLNV